MFCLEELWYSYMTYYDSLFHRTVKSSVTEIVQKNQRPVNRVQMSRPRKKKTQGKRKPGEKAEKVGEKAKEINTDITEKIVETKQTKVNTI